MSQSYDNELMRSIWESNWLTTGSAQMGEQPMNSGVHDPIRHARVRDYKDKFILRMLQDEALLQNPGFSRYDELRQDSHFSWVCSDGQWEPAGYYIVGREVRMLSKYEDRNVLYPETLTQLFVRPSHRRMGIGREMLRRYIATRGHAPLWVESPKWETRAMLNQLGYEETEQRYEIWQMMEGLTKWLRRWDL